MSVLEPYNISSIDFNNILFKLPKIIKNKKIIFLKYKKSNNFVVQLSKLTNHYISESNEIEFDVENNIIEFLNNLDNFIINEAKKNSDKWFNHIDDKSSIDYQRILNNNNTIKLKILDNENFKTIVTLNDEEICDFNNISENISGKVIIEVYAVWIKNNSFGLLLRPIKIGLTDFQNKYNYIFLDDSDSDSDTNTLFIKNHTNTMNETTTSTTESNDLNKLILGK
jgi:hypothetical protein